MTQVTAEDFTLPVGGVTLAARWLRPESDAGRQPVVFLHEGLGCIGMWQDFPERLVRRTGRAALVYDRYGHGGSDALAGDRPMSWMHDEALEVLPAVLAQCGLTAPPILFGHSDGGTIAALYAAHNPTRALITEAAHIFLDELTVSGMHRVEAQWERGVMQKFLTPFHGDKTEALVLGWLKHWKAQHARGWRVDGELSGIVCPYLGIQGSTDEYGTKRQLDELVDGVSGPAEKLYIDGCGHIPHLEVPQLIEDAVARFLAHHAD